MTTWEAGWTCLFNSLRSLKTDDLDKIIYIRKEPHTVIDAINRQLAHYAYHVGQIVVLCKAAANENWNTLTIPKKKK